jgi:hypothetical protein
MSLIDKVIKEANEQLVKSGKNLNDKILFIPRLEGQQEYTLKDVFEQSKDKDTELGKAVRMGVKGLLRRTGR